ncbi:MAG TPA: hypothetical protein VEH27_11605 [Methylomirabilota bacterium]|nr:hypothetical protein [Methylomirabilota bacterium]
MNPIYAPPPPFAKSDTRMPDYDGSLTPPQIDSIILFLKNWK